MKKIKILSIICVILTMTLLSCKDPGVTNQTLIGSEEGLPEELKGLKIYNVSTGGGNYVKVAIIDEKINSLTYQVGKTTQSVIFLNKEDNKTYEVSQVLMENDSLIVFRK